MRVYRDYKLHLHVGSEPPKPLYRGHPPTRTLRTQVFQLAACNWRCWYCFVDDDRLAAKESVAKFFTADELVELYRAEPDAPRILDLSGGQPDLAPEWCLWMMQALEHRALRGDTFVWSDDNLSTRYLFEHLSPADLDYIASFPRHSRVGCFKGYDEDSFAFNTGAEPDIFQRQFEIFSDLLHAGFDMYAYATFTSPAVRDVRARVGIFVDRLQEVSVNLPLRTIPLRIHPFTATRARTTDARAAAMIFQHSVVEAWHAELLRRFSDEERALLPDAVEL